MNADEVCEGILQSNQTEIPEELVMTSLRDWRVKEDLDTRLNCPHCKERDDNDHSMSFCREPTVVAAREKHYGLLTAAIHECKFKHDTACVLTSMYTLDNQGGHIDPCAEGVEKCNELVDKVLSSYPRAMPTRQALVDLLQMGPAERTQ